MVAAVAPAVAPWRRRRVPGLDVRERDVLSVLGGGAVYDDGVDVPHVSRCGLHGGRGQYWAGSAPVVGRSRRSALARRCDVAAL